MSTILVVDDMARVVVHYKEHRRVRNRAGLGSRQSILAPNVSLIARSESFCTRGRTEFANGAAVNKHAMKIRPSSILGRKTIPRNRARLANIQPRRINRRRRIQLRTDHAHLRLRQRLQPRRPDWLPALLTQFFSYRSTTLSRSAALFPKPFV